MIIAKGDHWSYDGEVLKIFDVYSCTQEKVTYLGESRECMTAASEHDRASQTISSRLMNLDNGFGVHRIKYIQINEYMAHLLFAEGVLRLQMLEEADEDEKAIFVPMIINNCSRTVAIRCDLTQAIVYFGPAGNPLKFS